MSGLLHFEIYVTAMAVAAGGSGYAVNDTFQLVTGAAFTVAVGKVLSVSGGAVTNASVLSGGQYVIQPTAVAGAATTLTGTGSGLTITPTIATKVAPEQISLSSLQPTRVSLAQSLKRQTRTRGAQRWLVKMAWSLLSRAQFMPFYAFCLSQRGQADTFTLSCPPMNLSQGTWGTTVRVNGAVSGGSTIVIDGLTVSRADSIKAGDILTFAGHTKVYMVTGDVGSDSSGNATIDIRPQLLVAVADNEIITTTNVVFTVALGSDNLDGNITVPVIYGTEINFVETW